MKAFKWPEPGKFHLELNQDWSEWFTGSFNWRNFCLINLAYEDEAMIGNREITAGLFGFTLRLTWVYNDQAATRVIIEKRLDDFMNDVAVKSIAIHPAALAELLAKAAVGKELGSK
jgi:hypothetical protein